MNDQGSYRKLATMVVSRPGEGTVSNSVPVHRAPGWANLVDCTACKARFSDHQKLTPCCRRPYHIIAPHTVEEWREEARRQYRAELGR